MTRKLPKAIRPEEFVKLIRSIPNKSYIKKVKIAFLLAYASGLRVSEIVKLKQENIIDGKRIEIWEAKGGVDRVVPIPKGWKQYMKDELPLQISVRSLERHFANLRDRLKFNKEYTFHSLRHGFATRCFERGIPAPQVQLLLGHSNLSTTSIYARARPKESFESYEELF